jgi:hypothetical protein
MHSSHPPQQAEEPSTSGRAPPRPICTTQFWRGMSGSPATRAAISEWLELGQLGLVQVHGSMEDERMFSAMAYLKNKYRTRLKELHLNVAAHLFNQGCVHVRQLSL